MATASISDYGFLSDCQTAALVHRHVSVDWYCPLRFDSQAVFSRLLDPDGGHWSIRPVGDFIAERAYIEDTMVLRTVFETSTGRIALLDTLAMGHTERGHHIGRQVPHLLVRQVEGLAGVVEVVIEFVPRPEYGLTTPYFEATAWGIMAHGGAVGFNLLVNGAQLTVEPGRAVGELHVRSGDIAGFGLRCYRYSARETNLLPETVDARAELENAVEAWQSWTELHHGYRGPYTEQVRRSALVLQGLTYQPTGAVIAAATTSLPETRGGSDNWDYRYSWLRDLSLTLRALWVAACPDEVVRFFDWVSHATGNQLENLQIMYGVEGERDLTEHTLDHLDGFNGATPVRVGNDAWDQKQLDVYGEIVDAIYLLRDQLSNPLDNQIRQLLLTFVNRAAERWREPDAGMWEARDQQRHYLTSKVMCWVALDRAIKLAPRLGDDAQVEEWEQTRDEIREAVHRHGWSEEVQAFTGAFGSHHLDASVLLMPLVGFLPASDSRMRSTIARIERELVDNGLVHRWAGDEHGFLICTYWLVECLALAGEIDRSIELFEQTTAYANDLGLLAEEVDPRTGELMGNFPQTLSHVGLINAAWRVGEVQRRQTP